METKQQNQPNQVLVMISEDQIQGTIDHVFFINDISFILVISFKATTRLELWQFQDFNDQKPVFVRELTEIYEYYKDQSMTYYVDENSSNPFAAPQDSSKVIPLCEDQNLLKDYQLQCMGVRRLPNNLYYKSRRINSSCFMLNVKAYFPTATEDYKLNKFNDEFDYSGFEDFKTCHVFQITLDDIKLVSSIAMETYDLLVLQTGNIKKSLKQKQTQFVLINTTGDDYKAYKYFLTPNEHFSPVLKYSALHNKNDLNQKYISIFESPYYRDYRFQQISGKKNYFIGVIDIQQLNFDDSSEPSDFEIYFKIVKCMPILKNYNSILYTGQFKTSLRVSPHSNQYDDIDWYAHRLRYIPFNIQKFHQSQQVYQARQSTC
eukprot:403344830